MTPPPAGASGPTRSARTPTPLTALLTRHERLPAWIYHGPLERGRDTAAALCQSLQHRIEQGVHIVESEQAATLKDPRRFSATTADTEEDAWRAHLGLLFGAGQAFPDDARPGETLIRYRSRVSRTRVTAGP